MSGDFRVCIPRRGLLCSYYTPSSRGICDVWAGLHNEELKLSVRPNNC